RGPPAAAPDPRRRQRGAVRRGHPRPGRAAARRAGRHDPGRAACGPSHPPGGLRGCDRGLPRRARDGRLRLMLFDLLYWIVFGFLAGALSVAMVGGRTARGCLPNVVVGVLGAIVGGWIARELGFGQGAGILAAIVVAVLGAVLVRVILEALSPKQRS